MASVPAVVEKGRRHILLSLGEIKQNGRKELEGYHHVAVPTTTQGTGIMEQGSHPARGRTSRTKIVGVKTLDIVDGSSGECYREKGTSEFQRTLATKQAATTRGTKGGDH